MSAIIKLCLIVFGIILAVAGVGVPYITKVFSLENKGEVKINDQIIVVDIVRDENTRAKGLGGREGLGINEGMLFLFEETEVYPFWMKGMEFPIDIVWIAESAIVGFDERVPPEPGVPDRALTVYAPPEPVDKVLELAAGRVRLLRAKVGDHVKIRRLLGGANGGARLPSFQELADAFRDWNEVNRGVR
ncbi:MAG: DUF192 domain-containing protein [Candidatus Jorgensenbacteria bacterium]|nr:DUF192 domain-containing protein [Candidatus Jorgensenbacteria bacterium]